MKPLAVFLPADIADSHAIQALARGDADEAAQKRALRCIIEEIAGTYEASYDPESERQTAFAEGRRHVGRVIVGIVNINLAALKAAEIRLAARKAVQPRKGKHHG